LNGRIATKRRREHRGISERVIEHRREHATVHRVGSHAAAMRGQHLVERDDHTIAVRIRNAKSEMLHERRLIQRRRVVIELRL
jgi:hypothetical protein